MSITRCDSQGRGPIPADLPADLVDVYFDAIDSWHGSARFPNLLI